MRITEYNRDLILVDDNGDEIFAPPPPMSPEIKTQWQELVEIAATRPALNIPQCRQIVPGCCRRNNTPIQNNNGDY